MDNFKNNPDNKKRLSIGNASKAVLVQKTDTNVVVQYIWDKDTMVITHELSKY